MVKADPDANTIADHLDSMALQANIHWQYHTGTLLFSPTVTRRYEIPLYGGAWNDIAITGNNLNAAGGETETGGARNTLTAQLSLFREINTLISATLQINPCIVEANDVATSEQDDEAPQNNPRALAGVPGLNSPAPIQECYAVSGTGNLITITARPQTLLKFEDAYNHFITALNRKVNLKIITLKVDVTDLSQQRLDLDIVRNNSDLIGSFRNINSDFTSTQVSGADGALGTILSPDT